MFPRSTKPTLGWTLDFDFMKAVQRLADSELVTLEQVEAVLLAAEQEMENPCREHSL